MARRFVEIITSDLTGKEVERADVFSFTWDGVSYEFDAGPNEKPGGETLDHLVEISRVATPDPDGNTLARPAAKTTSTAARPAAKTATGTGRRKGRIRGAPSFSPTEYFAMFGKVEPSGKRHWTCPVCTTEISLVGEPNTNAVTRFRQHIAANHQKLLWVIAAKRRHLAIPPEYTDRG